MPAGFPEEGCKMRRLETYLLVLLMVSVATVAAAETAAPIPVQDFDGVKVYRVPFYKSINVRQAELFPHNDPAKNQRNWKVAYIDLGYMVSHAVLEEVPARSQDVVGQKLLAEINYIVVGGEGDAVRREPDGTETRIHVRDGDIFFVPFGDWVGFANPSDTPLRLMGWMVAMVPAIMDQNRKLVDEDGLRAVVPYVVDYVRYQALEGAASSIGPVQPGATFVERRRPEVSKKTDFTVYEPEWGTPINMGTLEAPPHHYPKRAAEGWRDAHLEMGGRAINNFILQEEAPSFKEIGHKHGSDVLFYGLIGKGYIAIRPEVESVEKVISWGEGDLFALPRYNGGVWHSHGNYTNDRNRLIYTPPRLADVMMDPYQIRYIKDWEGDSVDRDQVWKLVKPPSER